MRENKGHDAGTDNHGATRVRRRGLRWVALAACTVLLIGAVFLRTRQNGNTGGALLDVVFPAAYAFDDYDTRWAVMDDNPVEDDFLAALHTFSYQTASQILAERSGNTNYAPMSLYYALALAASGADGETADELCALLGVHDQTVLSQQCGNLYRRLYTDNEIGTLKFANSLWMDNRADGTYEWNDAFIKNAAEQFYAHSFRVDFSDPTTGTLMSNWVKDHTNGTLAPDIETDGAQILSLLNTVYFYDEWIDRFDRAETAEDAFYPSEADAVTCEFMNATYGTHPFVRGDGFTRSALGMKNGGSMIFILPDEGVSVDKFISDPETMQAVFQGGESSSGVVVWSIPKFRFGTALDLADTIKKLGVKSAFEQDADFSGITNQPAFMTGIRQETHIAIDENGVEASAYTQIFYVGAAPPQGRADMILNRPFLYGIIASDGTLLFVGICENPNN